MAERQFVLEREPAAVHADDAAGHGDFREVNDVADAVVRRLAHEQLPVEHAVAHAVEENALRGRIARVPGRRVVHGAAGEIEVDVHAAQIARVEAAEAVFLRRAALRVVVFPREMRVEDELGIVVVIVIDLAGDDFRSAAAAVVDQDQARFFQHGAFGIFPERASTCRRFPWPSRTANLPAAPAR